jgi:hypothetical protein
MYPVENSADKRIMNSVDTGQVDDIRRHRLIVGYSPGIKWGAALDHGAPDTVPESHVRMISDEYPPKLGFPKEKEVELVNFMHEVPNDRYALDWAASKGFMPAGPRILLAIGAKEPELPKACGVPLMFISSLAFCSFGGQNRVVYLIYDAFGRRVASLGRPEVRCNRHCWFAFVTN